jgi:hypothetical protein
MLLAVAIWELLLSPLLHLIISALALPLVSLIAKKDDEEHFFATDFMPFLIHLFSMHVTLTIMKYVIGYFEIDFTWWIALLGYILSAAIVVGAGSGYAHGSGNRRSFEARLWSVIVYAIIYYIFG